MLRRLLRQSLPADLLASLDLEAVVSAMAASIVVEAEGPVDAAKPPPPGAAKPPPGAARPPVYSPPAAAPGAAPPPPRVASVKLSQTIPGVKAADVSGTAPR